MEHRLAEYIGTPTFPDVFMPPAIAKDHVRRERRCSVPDGWCVHPMLPDEPTEYDEWMAWGKRREKRWRRRRWWRRSKGLYRRPCSTPGCWVHVVDGAPPTTIISIEEGNAR